MTAADFHLASPPFVRVLGKGRKERLCPLLPQTARVVSRFLRGRGTPSGRRAPSLPESTRGEADASGRSVRAQEILGHGSQDDAEAEPARHQSAHAATHQGHALLAIGCPDHHDQGRARSRGRQVDRGLCPDRSGGQTQGLGAGRSGIKGRSPIAKDRARSPRVARVPVTGLWKATHRLRARKPGSLRMTEHNARLTIMSPGRGLDPPERPDRRPAVAGPHEFADRLVRAVITILGAKELVEELDAGRSLLAQDLDLGLPPVGRRPRPGPVARFVTACAVDPSLRHGRGGGGTGSPPRRRRGFAPSGTATGLAAARPRSSRFAPL